MNTKILYELDTIVHQQIQEDKKRKELENLAYFEGMEKGADLMMKAVRNYLIDESKKGGESDA